MKDGKQREVEVNEYDGTHGEGAWIVSASYVDDGSDVPDDVLEYLNDHYSEDIFDSWYQMQVGRAEDAYETDR